MLRSGFEYDVFVAGLGLIAGLAGVEDELGERSLTVFVAETTVADMNCGELGDDVVPTRLTSDSLALCASGVSLGTCVCAMALAMASTLALASASSILKLERFICPSTLSLRALARSALVVDKSRSSNRLAAAFASDSIAHSRTLEAASSIELLASADSALASTRSFSRDSTRAIADERLEFSAAAYHRSVATRWSAALSTRHESVPASPPAFGEVRLLGHFMDSIFACAARVASSASLARSLASAHSSRAFRSLPRRSSTDSSCVGSVASLVPPGVIAARSSCDSSSASRICRSAVDAIDTHLASASTRLPSADAICSRKLASSDTHTRLPSMSKDAALRSAWASPRTSDLRRSSSARAAVNSSSRSRSSAVSASPSAFDAARSSSTAVLASPAFLARILAALALFAASTAFPSFVFRSSTSFLASAAIRSISPLARLFSALRSLHLALSSRISTVVTPIIG